MSRSRPLLLLVLAAGFLTGCFSYKSVGRLRDGQKLPPSTRVTLYTGRQVVLATARLENDTIKGFEPGRSRPIDVPLAYVDLIETKRFDEKNTFIALGATAVLAYLGWQVWSLSDGLREPRMQGPGLVPAGGQP